MADIPGTVLYPAAEDSAASLIESANQALSTLAGALAIDGSSFTVQAGQGAKFSASGVVQIDLEILAYGTRSGDTFSDLTRGMEGTAPAAHGDQSYVAQEVTARSHSVLSEAIRKTQHKIGIGDDTPTDGDFLRGTGAGISTWAPITTQEIQDAFGYVPVNKAGDTMTGDLELDNLHVDTDAVIDRDLYVARNLHVGGDTTLDGDLSAAGDVNFPGTATINNLIVSSFLTAKGLKLPVKIVTDASYTIQSGDVVVLGHCDYRTVQLNFPPASDVGRLLITKVWRVTSPFQLMLVGWGSQLIEGIHSRFYFTLGYAHIWVADGNNWVLVSQV
jgi:hypothetical protein